MLTCEKCKAAIEPGTFHACYLGTLRAPWLKQMLDDANRPLRDELVKIRELLEKQAGNVHTAPAPTKPQRRETR